MNTSTNNRGFTLAELMVTVAIVSILASIALPGYQYAMRNARRAEAQGCLMELQNFMERFYTLNSCYKNKADGDPDLCESSDSNPTLPFTAAPKDGAGKAYDLAQQANDGNSYTLRATPRTGTGQALDGIMEIDGTGARRWDKNHDGDTTDTGESSWSR